MSSVVLHVMISRYCQDPPPTQIYTLSLPRRSSDLREPLIRLSRERHHDDHKALEPHPDVHEDRDHEQPQDARTDLREHRDVDRKSTRLNSSHLGISYAVFCLKKKNTKKIAFQCSQS